MKIVKTAFSLFTQPFIKVSEAMGSNKKSLKEAVSDSYKNFRSWLSNLLSKLQNLKKANLDLGKFHYANGNLHDAKVRLHILRIIFRDVPKEVYYYLGRAYFEQGKLQQATKYLDLYLATNDKDFKDEAIFTKKIIDDTASEIKKIPDTLISRQFNLLAPIYNDIYIVDNHSCIQNFILQDIKRTLSDIAKPFGNKLLDLGCGTGYIAKKLKDSKAISSATGIDLSSKMLDISNRLKSDDLKVYDDIQKNDAISYLKNSSGTFDIIIASQLMNHINDWHDLTTFCIEKLNKDGIFVFTFKVYGNASGTYFDRYTEEFFHSGDEVMSKLQKITTCSILVSKPLTFETENDTGLIILKRK